MRNGRSCLTSLARSLLQDPRGGVGMIMGIAIIPLFAAIGLAVDSGRGYLVQSKLQAAIDAAGLAGGRAVGGGDPETDMVMFFEAN